MTSMLRVGASLILALCLSGCIFYDHPHHRHWHRPYYGHPGYWR